MNRKFQSLLLLLAFVAAPALAGRAFAQAEDDEALWKTLDRNESGWLSGNELNGGWVKYDTDADGEVTKAEFLAGRGAETAAPQPNRGGGATSERDRVMDAVLFVKLDTSGEGYLDGGELTGSTFQRYDTNADGRVVLAEFAAGRAKDRLEGTTPARVVPAPARQNPPAARRPESPVVRYQPPALPAGQAIEGGLYFRIQSYFIGTSLSINQEHFAFWPDGRMYRGTPPGGLEFFDFAAAKQQNPSACGTYHIAGGKITFNMANGKSETHDFKRAAGGFNLDGIFTSRQKSYQPNERLAGHYDGGASAVSYTHLTLPTICSV